MAETPADAATNTLLLKRVFIICQYILSLLLELDIRRMSRILDFRCTGGHESGALYRFIARRTMVQAGTVLPENVAQGATKIQDSAHSPNI